MSPNVTTTPESNTSDNEDQMWYYDYPAYKTGIWIWKVVPPILILLGTIGNTLSIMILQRRTIRTSTTAFYLTALAFSDLLVLYTGLLRQWINFLFEVDVRHFSEAGCKINLFLVYFSLDMSAWILMAVTLERVISVWYPHSAKTKCTKKSAAFLLLFIAAFLAALNSHVFYGMGFRYSEDGSELLKCEPINDEYTEFFNFAWSWIDLCAFCLIPFTFIVIGNTLILVKVIKSQQKTKSRINPTIVTADGHTVTQARGKKSSMTAILFTLNVVFLFTTSPVSVYNIGYFHWSQKATEEEFADLDLWWAIVTMLQYTNNSLNFLLYCLSGTKFRQEFVNMIQNCMSKTTSRLEQSVYNRTQFQQSTSQTVLSQGEQSKARLSPSSVSVIEVVPPINSSTRTTNISTNGDSANGNTQANNTLSPNYSPHLQPIDTKVENIPGTCVDNSEI